MCSNSPRSGQVKMKLGILNIETYEAFLHGWRMAKCDIHPGNQPHRPLTCPLGKEHHLERIINFLGCHCCFHWCITSMICNQDEVHYGRRALWTVCSDGHERKINNSYHICANDMCIYIHMMHIRCVYIRIHTHLSKHTCI